MYRRWSDIVGVQPSPRFLHHQVRLARESLHAVTRDGPGWKTSRAMLPDADTALRHAAAARDLVAQLHPLAQHEHQIAQHAHVYQQLLVRTGDIAKPHRRSQPGFANYSPLPYQSFYSIGDAYIQAAQHSLTAATLLDKAAVSLGLSAEPVLGGADPAPHPRPDPATAHLASALPRPSTLAIRAQDRSRGGPDLAM